MSIVKWIDLECDTCGEIFGYIQRIGTLMNGAMLCDECAPDEVKEEA